MGEILVKLGALAVGLSVFYLGLRFSQLLIGVVGALVAMAFVLCFLGESNSKAGSR